MDIKEEKDFKSCWITFGLDHKGRSISIASMAETEEKALADGARNKPGVSLKAFKLVHPTQRGEARRQALSDVCENMYLWVCEEITEGDPDQVMDMAAELLEKASTDLLRLWVKFKNEEDDKKYPIPRAREEGDPTDLWMGVVLDEDYVGLRIMGTEEEEVKKAIREKHPNGRFKMLNFSLEPGTGVPRARAMDKDIFAWLQANTRGLDCRRLTNAILDQMVQALLEIFFPATKEKE